MDNIFQIMGSPGFQQTMFNFSIVCLALCLGAIVVASAYYGRGREVAKLEEDSKWVLLFATWRDSLIIAILYVADGLSYSQSTFQATSQLFPQSILLYGPATQPVISMILQVLIFAICALRIIALTRWLSTRSTG